MSLSGDWEAAVMLRVRRAPPELVRQALRDALRGACRDTGRWTAVLHAIVPADCAGAVGGEFPLQKAPEPCAVLRFLAVEWKRNGRIMPVAGGEFGFKPSADGRWTLVDRRGWVRGGDEVSALAALEPASTGYELDAVPEDVGTDLFGLVEARAARRLLSMPGAAWSDAGAAQLAAWDAQRELGMCVSRMNGDFSGGSRVTGVIDA